DPRARARFRREANLAAAVESDHVVAVLDAGVDASGAPFLVMELLRGEDLASVVAREGRLAASDVVGLVWQAGLALDRLHDAGIVHRDLKPQNLFLSHTDDGSPRLKVVDFGVAKIGATHESGCYGTPLFMAPEQLSADSVGRAADLYALAHVA